MPAQFFEELRKSKDAQSRWDALSDTDRQAVEFAFFEAIYRFEIAQRFTFHPDLMHNGTAFSLFSVDLKFCELLLAMSETTEIMLMLDLQVSALKTVLGAAGDRPAN